ncbi:hypothetical protein [Streptomyces aurantiogriseus]|uniref:Uncharacterized protein n=1 Tax=Streptomyces aurantiogriseus TaxID=66870 RepID=A0A918KZA0_9ACTN|nr:hypothetical protein [Streptomyces aurantiogriseus]GGR55195.1 hypothetical protein GCM10010251_85290 [Streptomyces aurantiogriseus]
MDDPTVEHREVDPDVRDRVRVTVHSRMEHLLRKTGCASRAVASALAVRDGVLRPGPENLGHCVERAALGRGTGIR